MLLISKIFGKKDKDQLVLDTLRREGSNLSKPHEIDFWFDFEYEEDAQIVAKLLLARGYAVTVENNDEAPFFSCRAVRKMVPTIDKMRELTQEFEALARKNNGVYDGWGAGVVH